MFVSLQEFHAMSFCNAVHISHSIHQSVTQVLATWYYNTLFHKRSQFLALLIGKPV